MRRIALGWALGWERVDPESFAKLISLLSAGLLSLCCIQASAQLDLDADFGVDGLLALQGIGPTDEGILDMQVDAFDRIIFVHVGTGTHGVDRSLADGTPDLSFGDDGRVSLDFTSAALMVAPDGAITVCGIADDRWQLARFQAAARRGDGGLVAAIQFGSSPSANDFLLLGVDEDGDSDLDFGTNGVATLDFAGQFDSISTLLVVPDWNGQGERIVAVGSARTGATRPPRCCCGTINCYWSASPATSSTRPGPTIPWSV